MAAEEVKAQALEPPFDTFIFDLDGTLLDTLDDLMVLTNDVLAEFDMPTHTREEINSYVGNGAAALIYQAVPADTPPAVADACLARWKEAYDRYPNDLTKPYPGIESMLAELRRHGCKLGILSNKFDRGVRDISRASRIRRGSWPPSRSWAARPRARCTSATRRETSTRPATPAAMQWESTGATTTRPISPLRAGSPICSPATPSRSWPLRP